MSYNPTIWTTGQKVTAIKMNKLEQGVANSLLIINYNNGTLDKTYAEIYDAINNGTPCYIRRQFSTGEIDLDDEYTYDVILMPIIAIVKYNDMYRVYASTLLASSFSNVYSLGVPAIWTFQVSASSGYPEFYRRVNVTNASCTVESNAII